MSGSRVLMVLHMTVKQRQAVIVRGEVSFGAQVARNTTSLSTRAVGWPATPAGSKVCRCKSMGRASAL
jgi:hypothetical protein